MCPLYIQVKKMYLKAYKTMTQISNPFVTKR